MKVPEQYPQQPQSASQIQYRQYSLDRDFPDHGDNELYMKVVKDSAVAIITNKICRVFDEQTGQWKPSPFEAVAKNSINKDFFYDQADRSYWYIQQNRLRQWKSGQVLVDLPLSAPLFSEEDKAGSMIKKPDGAIWFVNARKLAMISKADIDARNPAYTIVMDNFWNKYIRDNKGDLWVGTNGYGLWRVQTSQPKFRHIMTSSSVYRFQPLSEDTMLCRNSYGAARMFTASGLCERQADALTQYAIAFGRLGPQGVFFRRRAGNFNERYAGFLDISYSASFHPIG